MRQGLCGQLLKRLKAMDLLSPLLRRGARPRTMTMLPEGSMLDSLPFLKRKRDSDVEAPEDKAEAKKPEATKAPKATKVKIPKKKATKEKVTKEKATNEKVTKTAPTTPVKKAKKVTEAQEKSIGSPTKASPKKSASPRKPHSTVPPKDWRPIYDMIKELRNDRTAPVDAYGAEVLIEGNCSPESFKYQVLIALMLSSQTKDQQVAVLARACRHRQNTHVIYSLGG
jgi:hypothetical protein